MSGQGIQSSVTVLGFFSLTAKNAVTYSGHSLRRKNVTARLVEIVANLDVTSADESARCRVNQETSETNMTRPLLAKRKPRRYKAPRKQPQVPRNISR
jgi:aromatic ring hydroxylase